MLESSHQFDPARSTALPYAEAPGQSYSVRPLPSRNPKSERRAETEFTPGHKNNATQSLRAGSEPEFPIGHRMVDSHLGNADGETESISGQVPFEHHQTHAGDGTEFSEGHRNGGTQPLRALAETLPDVGHGSKDTPRSNADIGETLALIVENWRARQDFLRARMRLELQAQAVCRRYCDGDKAEAAKLWAKVKKDREHELLVWLEPYMLAMAPLDAAKHKVELKLAKLARDLPVYEWAKSVSGFGDVSLAAVVGECAIGPGEYRTVSALWKRMGMAVFDGQRQRKVSGDAAIEQGYNPTRRSLMWNIGCCLIKAQIRSEKDEKGKKVEGSEYAIGEYGQLYLDRKQYLRERSEAAEQPMPPFMLHKNAQRYIEKRLLRELWKAWRRASLPTKPMTALPASN